jgi:hypothetical protein
MKCIKRISAQVAVIAVLLPLMPFYALVVLGEWVDRKADDWRWPGKLVDISERIERWSRDAS